VVRVVQGTRGQYLALIDVFDHDDGERQVLAVKDDKVGLLLDGEDHLHLAAHEERRQIGMEDDAVAEWDERVGQADVVPRERLAVGGDRLGRRQRFAFVHVVQTEEGVVFVLLAAQWSHEGDDERTGEQDGQNDGHQTEGLFPRASRHWRVRVEFAFFIVDLGIALLYFISR